MAITGFVLILAAPLYIEKQNLVEVVGYFYDTAYSILLLSFSTVLIYYIIKLSEIRSFFKREYKHIFL